MSTKHKTLCRQRIWNSNDKINKTIKIEISIKTIPTCFPSTLEVQIEEQGGINGEAGKFLPK